MVTDPFDAAGTLESAYRRVDWAATGVGPVSSWDPVLRAALDLALNTRFAVTLFWGARYTLLYNQAYADMIGDKHPAALGSACADVFPEIWDTIGPMLDSVDAGRGATWVEDLRLIMDRHGFDEETYFTFSYSPVHGPDAKLQGIIDIASETTGQVVGSRRLALLSALAERIADVDTVPDLVDQALPVLATATDDVTAVRLELTGHDLDRDVVVEPGPRALVRLTGGAALIAGLSPHLAVDAAYLGFLRLIGTALTQGLHRVQARELEHRATEVQREIAEVLQRSLLEAPVQPDHLQVAVRYQPAAEGAQIGGDWYDSFVLPDGNLSVVVGDVTGHDRFAAATMSQVRNLLRGISFTMVRPPSEVFGVLDEAMQGLRVGPTASAILARVERLGATRVLRWSNAGHPPPVLLHPDGSVQILERKGEALLNTRLRVTRTDHAVELEAGASVVFFTDGLVERRGRHFDDGLAELTEVLRGRHDLDAQQLCDHILAELVDSPQDDVVLTVLRATD